MGQQPYEIIPFLQPNTKGVPSLQLQPNNNMESYSILESRDRIVLFYLAPKQTTRCTSGIRVFFISISRALAFLHNMIAWNLSSSPHYRAIDMYYPFSDFLFSYFSSLPGHCRFGSKQKY